MALRRDITGGGRPERRNAARLAISYVVPLATAVDEDVEELASYLRDLARHVDDVIVVDGSTPMAVASHRQAFGRDVRTVEPWMRTPMGKVGNVLTGVQLAEHEHVVVADDDVRYEPGELHALGHLLVDATVVRPQNWFDPLPWHARFDTARTLLARATGGDWPGTLAFHRSALLAAGGYAGDVLFENLELVRTLRAAGGSEHLALDLLVRRVPPTPAHFRGQQVRQAYDELARPARLLLSLAVLPAAASTWALGRRAPVLLGAATTAAAAEAGRRRAGGKARYPASSSLLAPVWLAWRSVCSWLALGALLRGGARYRGTRLRRAATSPRALRRRFETGCAATDDAAGSTCVAQRVP